MDGFTSGWGGGCAWESCAAWREHYKKQFLVVASGDFRHSLRIRQEIGGPLRNLISESEPVKIEAHNGHVYPVEVRMEAGDIVLRSGWHKFVHAHQIEENFSILFMYRGNSTFKVQIFDSAGQGRSLSCSQPPSRIFGAVPPRAPSDEHVLNVQVVPDPGHVQASIDIVYTTWRRLMKAQDEKVLEMANIWKSEIPLHVAVMDKRNINFKDSCLYIPLQLVPDQFKDKITKTTIQLEAPDNNVCSVGASKHNDNQIVLGSEWDTFVASHHIQENDLLIFRSTEKTRIKVFILDPNGHEKTSSCSVTGNCSSSAQKMCDGSVQFVVPPPSDDDDIVIESMRKSCRARKRVTHSCAKSQKMASTSSPSTKSRYGARKPHDRACLKLVVGPEPVSNNLWWPSQRPYILSQGKPLPLQVEMEVVEKVQAIRSEFPIYVKVLTTSNVDRIGSSPPEMTFSMGYGFAYLPDKTQPVFLEMEGMKKVWHATLSVTKRQQRRVYFGWKEFVEDNKLKAGDICLFQLASSNAGSLTPTMVVHLIRKSGAQM